MALNLSVFQEGLEKALFSIFLKQIVFTKFGKVCNKLDQAVVDGSIMFVIVSMLD